MSICLFFFQLALLHNGVSLALQSLSFPVNFSERSHNSLSHVHNTFVSDFHFACLLQSWSLGREATTSPPPMSSTYASQIVDNALMMRNVTKQICRGMSITEACHIANAVLVG